MVRFNLISPAIAAEMLDMPRHRLVRLARRGTVPCVMLPDGELRFDADDLANWVRTHKAIPAIPIPTDHDE